MDNNTKERTRNEYAEKKLVNKSKALYEKLNKASNIMPRRFTAKTPEAFRKPLNGSKEIKTDPKAAVRENCAMSSKIEELPVLTKQKGSVVQSPDERQERKLRVKNYKKCLDLQMQVKNAKANHEIECIKKEKQLFNQRSKKLAEVEQELAAQKQLAKHKLAEIYDSQIAERSRSLINRFEADTFNDNFEVNRSRYFKVELA